MLYVSEQKDFLLIYIKKKYFAFRIIISLHFSSAPKNENLLFLGPYGKNGIFASIIFTSALFLYLEFCAALIFLHFFDISLNILGFFC